jgi:hypothetical protein
MSARRDSAWDLAPNSRQRPQDHPRWGTGKGSLKLIACSPLSEVRTTIAVDRVAEVALR